MEGVGIESNFYTMSNGSVVMGSVVVGESFPLLIWSRRLCCLCYVGIRPAKMAAIAGTRPSITTNVIIIEMIAAIFS